MHSSTARIEILDELAASASTIDGPRVPEMRSALALFDALIGVDAQAPSRARAFIGAVAALSARLSCLAFADLAPDDARRNIAIVPCIALGGEELKP